MRRSLIAPYITHTMHSVVQRYIGLFLVLLLGLTSQSMAVARAAPGPAGQIELCTGTGPVMVYADEDGQPIGAPHICPDYALSLLVHVADPDPEPHVVDSARILTVENAAVRCTALFCPHRVARGPPRSA